MTEGSMTMGEGTVREPAKLPLESVDSVKENVAKLCTMFPEIVSEGGGQTGMLALALTSTS